MAVKRDSHNDRPAPLVSTAPGPAPARKRVPDGLVNLMTKVTPAERKALHIVADRNGEKMYEALRRAIRTAYAPEVRLAEEMEERGMPL